jgi:DMSO/TMAO reductase YedYZ heme-binding membrane subunit
VRRVRDLDRRYAFWGAGLLLAAAMPVLAGWVGLGWELSQMSGLASGIACIALCGAPVRPRDSVPPTLLSLDWHQFIGWAALVAAILHIAGLVLVDRTVLEYLKPTTPLYQFAGIAATVTLLILVLSSVAGVRRRLWASHRGFQASHVILGCLAALLIAIHVIATDRYVNGRVRRALFLAVAIGAMLMLLRRRRRNDDAGRRSAMRRQFVFGRHSALVVAAVALTAVALAGLFRGAASSALREPVVQRANAIPLDFPHGKHGAINCLKCHHNYADGTGWDSCVRCHRSATRTDLKAGVEARFHGFCFDCHRNPEATLTRHGPVAGCATCHQVPGTAR